MNFKKFISLVCILVLTFGTLTTTYALEDQFEINATVAVSDSTAPSVPTGLSATAVSVSQINLTWTASTNDVAVTGYKIYRDSVYIATSASTSYSDTGLSAATTYSYTVSAIDAASNESAQSASASATTFTASTQGGGSQHQNAVIYDLSVVPTETGATITWKTTMPAVSVLSWGQQNDYELGQSASTIYTTVHGATIYGLSAATVYLYSIEVTNGYGINTKLDNQSFKTLAIAEYIPNPIDFTATPREADILLTWKNPATQGFKEVRLVKNKNFFPSDPNDGEVIYEGGEENFTDAQVEKGKTYYYALFTVDNLSNFSSGVLTSARIKIPGEPEKPPIDEFETIPQAANVHPQIKQLTFLDFDFIQDGKKLTAFADKSSVVINGDKNLTVSLDYQKVPEVLKSIIITLTHPSDSEKTFSFLLRVNKEKTAYVATIAPLNETGEYGVRISIIDYKNQGLKKLNGNLLAVAGFAFDQNKNAILTAIGLLRDRWINILLLIILVLIFFKSLHMAIKRKKEKEKNEFPNA